MGDFSSIELSVTLQMAFKIETLMKSAELVIFASDTVLRDSISNTSVNGDKTFDLDGG